LSLSDTSAMQLGMPQAAPRNERPETARPPMESEAPPDDVLDADGLDIDALLPATFEGGAARVMMGQDLADLLRAAEERIEGRGEASRQVDSSLEGTDVPVPEDVLELLAEPLEGDDEENATGASLGTSSAGTGAERLGTHDGLPVAPQGEEEDLEQPLPRASDAPKEPTQARALTGAGRSDSQPPYLESPRAASTRPGSAEEAPLRAEPPPPRTSERGARRFPSQAPLGPGDRDAAFDRETGFDREAALEQDAAFERDAAFDREAALDRRAPADRRSSPERDAAFDRRSAPERDAAFDRRGAPERDAAFDRRGAPERDAAFDRRSAPERDAAFERPANRMVEMRTIEMRAIERPGPTDSSQRPVTRPGPTSDAAPRSRAVRTDAMPAVLGPGDAARALGRAIAGRVSVALLVVSGDDQRRILLHDGDVVTAGSSAPVEALVAFLAARGDIDRDLVPRLAGKLPPFGRHAGAALVANGHLGQDDLWPVLRAHSEWVIGRALLVESGTCELEADPPARFKAEPSVFGGATGAEVLVDVMQRVTPPETALARLGGYGARIAQGPRAALLGECALGPDEEDAVRAAPGRTVHELAGDGPTDRWSMLYALACLDVLDVLPAVSKPPKREESAVDPLDEEALRQRVRARLAIVEEGDYFALLGVPRGATSYEIRRAYVDLRRTLEPSKVLTAGTADLAADLRLVLEVLEEAFEILRDANRRDRYRRAIETGPPR
jgi:hypothetical protein